MMRKEESISTLRIVRNGKLRTPASLLKLLEEECSGKCSGYSAAILDESGIVVIGPDYYKKPGYFKSKKFTESNHPQVTEVTETGIVVMPKSWEDIKVEFDFDYDKCLVTATMIA